MFNGYNQDDKEYIQNTFVYYGVNEIFTKSIENQYGCKKILEYDLPRYDPFLQKRGFMETSAYLHVYRNGLYKHLDFVGFCQYDMAHKKRYENLDKNTIYLLRASGSIVQNGQWHPHMFSGLRNIDYLLNHYNRHFGTEFTMTSLEGQLFSLWQTNIYPVQIYEKLCTWLDLLVKDAYPWSVEVPYETHWGVIGGYTERAIGLFNALEIIQGCNFEELNLEHCAIYEKHQYSQGGFLNFFDKDISTRYIENITNREEFPKLNFAMFKAMYQSDNEDRFFVERLMVDGKNGLIKTSSINNTYELLGFDIEAEDPRLITVQGILYIVFICISPYYGQDRCIAITPYSQFNPVFLRVRDMNINTIEKNWAPFVQGGELYFVYNYDPLIIIKYNFNGEGFCDVIFRQGDTSLPIDTSNTFLRGGSNLVHYRDGLFIGGCHSRMKPHKFFHFTHIVLLDVVNWRIVYLSKPVAYLYAGNELETLEKASILIDLKINTNCIQDPISMNPTDDLNKYLVTINVRDNTTLLYEIEIGSSISLITDEKEVGYWDKQVNIAINL